MPFDISAIVADVGEAFTISGVSRSYNDRGDPTETYTTHICSGCVQVMDGSEDEVQEGILQKEDIIVFVGSGEPTIAQLKLDNYLNIVTITSGIFRITNVISNSGHLEIQAKKILDTSP